MTSPTDLTGPHRPPYSLGHSITDTPHRASRSTAGEVRVTRRGTPHRCQVTEPRRASGRRRTSLAATRHESWAAHMAMSIEVIHEDGGTVHVRASGGYAPDVMNDLQNRAMALMTHAARLHYGTITALDAFATAKGAAVEDDEEGVNE